MRTELKRYFANGHLGKAMGFEDKILYAAGGVVQIWEQNSSWDFAATYFDDARDYYAVKRGVEMYKATHPWFLW